MCRWLQQCSFVFWPVFWVSTRWIWSFFFFQSLLSSNNQQANRRTFIQEQMSWKHETVRLILEIKRKKKRDQLGIKEKHKKQRDREHCSQTPGVEGVFYRMLEQKRSAENPALIGLLSIHNSKPNAFSVINVELQMWKTWDFHLVPFIEF